MFIGMCDWVYWFWIMMVGIIVLVEIKLVKNIKFWVGLEC